MVIGISGKKGSGKDSIADVLVRVFGYTKYGMASHLKELDRQAFEYFQADRCTGDSFIVRCQQIYKDLFGESAIDPDGVAWEMLEMYKNPIYSEEGRDGKRRLALQFLGTDILRKRNPNIHCNALYFDGSLKIPDEINKVVIPDIRFPNEADALKKFASSRDLQPVIIRVEREALSAGMNDFEGQLEQIAQSHPSEMMIDQIEENIVLINNGTLSDLEYKLMKIVNELGS